ncbi:MBG domain-containing protein [Flavisolibacter nicotianae]|uniref:MBG domain-containing protein n=1 Tax=Flavisolibacter nicotianae TaxID=2364882 RepID=UPI0013C4275E|nr:MBG domain-containing protein [Flavisolibacter nicotianae]
MRRRTYGQTVTFAGTEFTPHAGDLVNGDAVASVTLVSSGAAATAAKGSYDITASAATGTGLGNYDITYAKGTLTVDAKALDLRADGNVCRHRVHPTCG